MKALTILQPWASLIPCGAKKIETRSWSTKYRGPIAIHAGKRPFNTTSYFDRELYRFSDALGLPDIFSFDQLPLGAVIGIAELVACELMTPELIAIIPEPERSFGWYEPGRYMWMLKNPKPIQPIPAKGMQRLWEWREILHA